VSEPTQNVANDALADFGTFGWDECRHLQRTIRAIAAAAVADFKPENKYRIRYF
jgi:hypothetical protein